MTADSKYHYPMYAAETWPPKPADVYIKISSCSAMSGRAETIDYGYCTSINTSPQRNFRCKGCTSAYRICSACTIQHVTAPDIRDIDPETGLCAWHTEFGAEAIRPSEEIPAIRRRGVSAVPTRFSLNSYAAIAEAVETDQATADISETTISVPSGSEVAFDDLLERYCEIAKNRFTQYRMLILSHLAKGHGREEMAQRLKTDKNSVSMMLMQMAKVLGIPTDNVRVSKIDHVTVILTRVAKKFYSTA